MEVKPEDLSTFRLSVSLPAWLAVKVASIMEYCILVSWVHMQFSTCIIYIYYITTYFMHSLKYLFKNIKANGGKELLDTTYKGMVEEKVPWMWFATWN